VPFITFYEYLLTVKEGKDNFDIFTSV